MPTFPAFRQRLNQINKPLYAGAAETPMEFGMPMSEGEKNRKLRKEIADKKTGRGRGASDEPTKPIERFPNIFQAPQNQFGWPPKGNKLPIN